MISFTEAQQIITGFSRSFGTEMVSLDDATGRILAEAVVADRDYPPFNRATMDGYALKFADVDKGILEFKVVETIFAGQVSQVALQSNECYKIMTGAAVPESADMIIQRENVIDDKERVAIQVGKYKPYQQVSKKGEDVKKGERVVDHAAICTPAVVSALAALGMVEVRVEKLPVVSLFTTGNEVVAVGEPVSSFQIRNSNQFLFRSLLNKWGIQPFLCEHIRDDKTDLYEMLSKGLKGDIVMISGGVSAGDADYVPEILESLGVIKLFHKVAIKPGKPFWCGHVPGGAMVFALPGNPFSGLVTFTLFVEAYLSKCLNGLDPVSVTLPLNGYHDKKSTQDEFFPVAIDYSTLTAAPLTFNGSGDILAALHADGIAHHPAETNSIPVQTPVNIRLFR